MARACARCVPGSTVSGTKRSSPSRKPPLAKRPEGGNVMTGRTRSDGGDANSLRKVVTVKAPPLVAWRVFTGKMGSWWPLASYKIGQARAVDAVIEPRVGGRWYERGEDGSTCDWG